MKFGKKYKDLSNAKAIEPHVITGINRLVCTSKSHNVELKGKIKTIHSDSSLKTVGFNLFS